MKALTHVYKSHQNSAHGAHLHKCKYFGFIEFCDLDIVSQNCLKHDAYTKHINTAFCPEIELIFEFIVS